MIQPLIKRSRKVAATGVLLLCTGTSVSAGLFCNWYVDPIRPYYSPECEPNYGYHPTRWKQFPPMTDSFESGDFCPSCQPGAEVGTEVWNGPGLPTPVDETMMTEQGQGMHFQNMQIQNGQGQIFSPPMTEQSYPNPGYPSGRPDYNYNSSPMTAPGPVVPQETQQFQQTQPMQMPSMQGQPILQPSAGTPQPMYGNQPFAGQPTTLTPMPDTLPGNSQQFNPVPIPDGNLPSPMEMPPLPDQTNVQGLGNRHPAGFAGNRVPVQVQLNQPNRVFNGRLAYGRYGGPIPVYQQPQNGQTAEAQPLVINTTQPQRVPVKGISFSRDVSQPESENGTPTPGYKRWLRMPRLPAWGR
jgi:hypothetical protein